MTGENMPFWYRKNITSVHGPIEKNTDTTQRGSEIVWLEFKMSDVVIKSVLEGQAVPYKAIFS